MELKFIEKETYDYSNNPENFQNTVLYIKNTDEVVFFDEDGLHSVYASFYLDSFVILSAKDFYETIKQKHYTATNDSTINTPSPTKQLFVSDLYCLKEKFSTEDIIELINKNIIKTI